MRLQFLETLKPNLTRISPVLTSVRVLAVSVALAALVLYWRTAAPTVLSGDSGELQFAAWGFWLAHPTGYPLYLIVGGIWQHVVQIGDPAFRLNLFSAFCSALAVGVAFLVFWCVTRARGAAVIAALTFAVSPLFWSQATRAEVYALNTLFITVLTLLGLLWREKQQRRYAIAFALTLGLSLAHHRTTVLLLPAFAALFGDKLSALDWRDKVVQKRACMYLAIAAVPLLLYLYIPLRAGATPYAVLDVSPGAPIVVFENSPRGWLNVILGSGFSGELGWNEPSMNALRQVPNKWIAELNPVGVLIALVGFVVLLWQRKFAVAALVLFGALTFILFNSAYHIGDIADYYTPVYFFACLSIAAGIGFVTEQLRGNSFTRHSTLPAIALMAFFALLFMQNLFSNFYSQDRSQFENVRTQWAGVFSRPPPANAPILLSNDRDEMTALYYLQLVEKQHPDWLGVFPKIAPGAPYENVVSLVQRVAASGRPIYTLKPIPALTLRYPVRENYNGMWEVSPVAPGLPTFPSDVTLSDALRVRGYSVAGQDPSAGERATLLVQYVPLKKLTRDYTTSVQLFDSEGNKVAQGNDHIPGEQEYPSSKWRAGETIVDRFVIELPPSLQTGSYKIFLRMYELSSGQELGELSEIGEIGITE